MDKSLPDSAPLSRFHRAGWLGNHFLYEKQVGSTNDWALELALEGADEGLVILAEKQTKGRGRLNRRWSAPAGMCLLMSLLFRPQNPFQYNASRITMACGMALLDAIRKYTSVPAMLKWPNDIIVSTEGGWGKLAGMLSEVGLESDEPAALVVGIGLNVNVPQHILSTLAPNAASLMVQEGVPVNRLILFEAVLSAAEKRIDAFRAGDDVLDMWRKNLAWVGEQVLVTTPTSQIQGVAESVDDAGALIVRLHDGTTSRFTVGDVSLRPE